MTEVLKWKLFICEVKEGSVLAKVIDLPLLWWDIEFYSWDM